jgi:hypothetical protein
MGFLFKWHIDYEFKCSLTVHADARKPEYGFSYLMLMVDMLLTFHAKCSPQIVLVRYLS